MITRAYISAVFLITSHLIYAQNDLDFNLLNAPATPAATLLGFAPSEIDKPRDASAFLGSIVTQTDGLSNLPSNYAVEIAPAWMFGREKITFEKFASNEICNNLWQSLSLSAAVRRSEASEDKPMAMTQAAFGIKLSLSRGEFSDSTKNQIKIARNVLKSIHSEVEALIDKDALYQELINKNIDSPTPESKKELDEYRASLYRVFSENSPSLKKLESVFDNLKFIRKGFKLDLTAGIVQDYPNDSYDNRSVSKFGTWLTAGYEGEKGGTLLGIARLLKSPDADYKKDDGTLAEASVLSSDFGLRGLWTPSDKPWSISGEALYRKVYEPEELDANWRWSINIEYKINTELSLNFSYGRDFEGNISRDGNVIALLSMFTSFGNKKPVGGI